MDIEEEDEYDFAEQDKTVSTPSKARRKSEAIGDSNRRSSSVKVEIKTAEIHLGETEIGAPHISDSHASLERTVEQMPGVLTCTVVQQKAQQSVVA